jgi:hypothetical protein
MSNNTNKISLGLQALLEEYKQALSEISTYTKLTFQMFSMFFIFVGTVIGLTSGGHPLLYVVAASGISILNISYKF